MFRFLYISIVLFLFTDFCYSTNNKTDSIKASISLVPDSTKVKLLSELVKNYLYINNDSAYKYANQGLVLAEKYKMQSHFASFLNNIANVYLEKGEYSNALNKYIEAEKQFKLNKDQKNVLMVNTNIGMVYELQNLLQKAILQYESVIASAQDIDDKPGHALALNRLGSVYYTKGDKVKALECFKTALNINEELNDIYRIMECLNNVAVIYQELGEYEKAFENFNQYLNHSKNEGDKRSQIIAYHNLALVYKDQKNILQTINYLDSSITIARQIKDFENLIEIYSTFTEIFTQAGNYEKAFETIQLKDAYKDSLLLQSREKQFIEMSTKYETDKKDAENKVLKATSETQKTINIAVTIGLILVAALAFFIFRSYRQKQKANNLLAEQNTEIKEQKGIIEEKQKEILDSITYAKRLQEAILPPVSHIKKHLPDSFIYYKPKDIVAGDFYWMEHKDNITFIAAADCTGHGVPGAMVSVVCSNALNRAVLEFNLTDPGQILDKTRELVLETFAKSDSDVKDGMDISLCAINKTNSIIKWAGANNPLWYTNDHHINEITANKQPIGKVDNPVPFTTHQIQLSKGDSIFLFTDGLPDQFGGPKGKKFKYKQFQELLLSNLSSDGEKCAKNIDITFTNWKGNLEQVDDVCVIGIRI